MVSFGAGRVAELSWRGVSNPACPNEVAEGLARGHSAAAVAIFKGRRQPVPSARESRTRRWQMLAGTRILLVEDEYLMALLLEDLIIEAGGEVVGPVRSNRDAIDLIGRRPIDLALIDVNVVDGDTTPTMRLLRDNGVPTMVCTGGMLPLAMQREGFSGPVFAKPIAPAEILRGLEGIMAPAVPAEPEYVPSGPGMR